MFPFHGENKRIISPQIIDSPFQTLIFLSPIKSSRNNFSHNQKTKLSFLDCVAFVGTEITFFVLLGTLKLRQKLKLVMWNGMQRARGNELMEAAAVGWGIYVESRKGVRGESAAFQSSSLSCSCYAMRKELRVGKRLSQSSIHVSATSSPPQFSCFILFSLCCEIEFS